MFLAEIVVVVFLIQPSLIVFSYIRIQSNGSSGLERYLH
jgi:hypothetical protein